MKKVKTKHYCFVNKSSIQQKLHICSLIRKKTTVRINPFYLFLFTVLVLPTFLCAQKGIITVGFQYKPIFNNDFFRAGAQSSELGNSNVTISPKSGFCAGMVIRKGITDRLSLETGINFVKRNYAIELSDSGETHQDDFRFIGYEIPLSALIYIRLGEKIYMDASLGNSFDFYPSDIYSSDEYYQNIGLRNSWLKAAVIANLGFEYRTEKSGYFYLGASYHRPYTYLFRSATVFEGKSYPAFINDISGNYLTLDIRYFFNETPLKSQSKRYPEDSNY